MDLDEAAAISVAAPLSAADEAAIASGAGMPIDPAVLAAARARPIGEEAAHVLAQQIANERRPRIEVRGVGTSSFAPVGAAETPRAPVRRPVRADSYSANDLCDAYRDALEIADERDHAAGAKRAKRFSTCNKPKAVVAAALDAVMRDYDIAEVPRAPVPNRASVARIAVGTQLCRPNRTDEHPYKFGRVCKVDADGTLHIELYNVTTLGQWNLTGMNTLYHCRVDAAPSPSAKRARTGLDAQAETAGAVRYMRAARVVERACPRLHAGSWTFVSDAGNWALWTGERGDEFHEVRWFGR